MTRLLHISDPHFSADASKFHFAEQRDAWAQSIIEPLQIQQWTPDVIVVSGDLTYTGDANDFEIARKCLRSLRERFDSSPGLLIVPGNHDMRWKVEGRPSTDEERLAGYAQFIAGSGAAAANKFHGTVLCTPSVSLVGLNSARIENVDTAGLGYVGDDQIAFALSQMREQKDFHSDAPKVAVLHHHLLPVVWAEPLPEPGRPARRSSLTLDAEAIQQRLMHAGFDVVLHGHQHQPFIREVIDHQVHQARSTRGRLIVCAAGSVSVARDHVGNYRHNHFQTLEINRELVDITYYRTSDNHDRTFVPCDPVHIRRPISATTARRSSRAVHVSLSGAMSVGKRTLAELLRRRMAQEMTVLPDIGRRMIAKARGADLHADDDDYLEYIRLHMCNMSRPSRGHLVHIRSLIDVYAYANIDKKLKPSTLSLVRDAARLAANLLDLVVYIPIEAHVPITTDGVRNVDAAYRERLDESIQNALTELQVDYVRVVGTPEQRVEQLFAQLALRPSWM